MLETKVYTPYRHIVFYDGNCMLCNSIVQYLLKKEIKNLYFSSLQSQFAATFLRNYKIDAQRLNTVYFYKHGELFSHSTAVLKAISIINPFFKMLSSLLLIVPRSFRDIVYRFIASIRHRIIKSKECHVPTTAQKKMILY